MAAISATPAFADEATPAAITVIDVDGNKLSAPLKSLGPSELTIGDGTSRRLSIENVLRMEFPNSKPVVPADAGLILLANGDCVFARITGIDAEHLTAEPASAGAAPLRIPLETVVAVAFDVPDSRNAQGRLIARLNQQQEATDVVLLRNGDRAAGEIVGMNASSISLKTAAGETKIEQSAVRAVVFNSELVSFPKPEGLRLLLSLADGSQLTVRPVELTNRGSFRVAPLFGGEMELAATQVREARVLGGRAVYLSDLEPAAYQFTPYLSTTWPLKKDAGVSGSPLQLRGADYPKGLGMHSQSVVVYRLDGKYRRFLALGGLDDAAGERGSVVLSVDVDDKRVVTSPVLTAESPQFEVGPFDVTGKQRLTLRVNFGPFGDIQDHANWCDAVLLKYK